MKRLIRPNIFLKSFVITVSLIFTSLASSGQSNATKTCPSSYTNSSIWPTHENWFFGDGQTANFNGGVTFSTVAGTPAITSYEGTSAVSDEQGNLLFFTNGRRVWDSNGNMKPYNLTTGNEDIRDNGSAVQGVLIVRHPLNPDVYHVFCTDDVISNNNMGLDYFTLDQNGDLITGPTTILAGRSYEGMSATFHGNGVDIWVMTQSFATGDYNAFLIGCDGLDPTPIVSDMGISFEANKNWTRGSLEFSWDGTKLAQGHPAFWPVGEQEASIFDFDNISGQLSNAQHFSSTATTEEVYDVEWSPDNSLLYVTTKDGGVHYYDVSSGNAATITPTYTNVGNLLAGEASIELGGDGIMYVNNFAESNLYRLDGGLNGGASGLTEVPVSTDLFERIGLPNMYLPPRDWLIIQDPGALTECDLPYDFSTEWHCKGTDAENTPLYANAYSVDPACATCTIDPVTGVFNAPGAGTYTIYFEICEIKDTLTFDIGICGCDADVQDGPFEICSGEDFLLDSLIITNSGDGVWSLDSVPTGAEIPASINEGVDTVFETNIGTLPGTYKLKYTITGGGCEDSTYIIVNPTPQASIDPFGPLCSDSTEITLSGSPNILNDTTGAWLINNNLQVDGLFNPETNGNIVVGQNTITYAVELNGCYDTTSIDVQVKERAVVNLDPAGPFCASVTNVLFSATPDTGVWFIDNGAAIGNNGSFNPSNAGADTYEVIHQVQGQCGGSDTIDVVVNPVKDATINTDTGSYCVNDPQFNLDAAFVGGTWHIDDTTTAAIGGVFDPADYVPGDYDVIYVQPNPCGDVDTVRITVLPLKDPTITANKTVFCAEDDSVQFTGAEAGGTWSGAGINPNTGWFTPANGTDDGNPYDIIYTITGACGQADTIQVTVNPMKDASISNFPAANDTLIVCVLDNDPQFNVVNGGGTWNNGDVNLAGTNVTIDIQTMTNNGVNMVTNEMLIYSLGAPCPDQDTVWITTTSQLDATINAAGPFCDTDDDFQLTRPNSATGTWTSDCGACLDANGLFSPSTAGAGTHEITFTIPGNCGDVETLDITVNGTPNPTILNGDTIKDCENGNLVFLQTAENGGTWSAIGDDKGGLDVPGPAFLPNTSGDGTFAVQYSFAGSCPAADTLILVFDPVPEITFDNDGPYCDTEDPVQLNATPAGGTWSGAGITDQAQGIFNPGTANVGTHVNPGQNLLVYDVQDGLCSASSRDTVYVIRQVDASIDPVGPYCNKDSVVNLTATDSLGTWTGNGITDQAQGIFNPNGLSAGVTTITHTITGQCGDSKTLDIVIEAPLDPTITDQGTICLGEQAQVQFNAVDEGTWSGDNVDANGVLTVVDSGNYMIVNTIAGLCPVEDTSFFRVEYVPTVNFEADIINECVGFTESFTDITDTSASGAVVSSVWSFGNGLQSTSLLSATSPYNSAGTYDVTLTNTYANGCSSSTTRQDYITAYPFPTANFSWEPNPPSVLDNAVQFINGSTGGEFYLWEFDSRSGSTPSSDEFSPAITFNVEEADTVNVTLITTTVNGCADTIVKPVPILDFFNIFVPNAFTPHNGDGINDTFYPKGRNITADGYEFMIFNRWGQLIWQTNQPGVGWDGTVDRGISGDPQQIDVYVWKLIVKDQFTGDRIVRVGTVTIAN